MSVNHHIITTSLLIIANPIMMANWQRRASNLVPFYHHLKTILSQGVTDLVSVFDAPISKATNGKVIALGCIKRRIQILIKPRRAAIWGSCLFWSHTNQTQAAFQTYFASLLCLYVIYIWSCSIGLRLDMIFWFCTARIKCCLRRVEGHQKNVTTCTQMQATLDLLDLY